MAISTWGFGFYGNGVDLAELSRIHGWPLYAVGATSGHDLASALLVAFVSDIVGKVGPRAMILGGTILLAAAVLALGRVQAPWAALRHLPPPGAGLGGAARGCDQQHPEPLVRPAAQARAAPRAEARRSAHRHDEVSCGDRKLVGGTAPNR